MTWEPVAPWLVNSGNTRNTFHPPARSIMGVSSWAETVPMAIGLNRPAVMPPWRKEQIDATNVRLVK